MIADIAFAWRQLRAQPVQSSIPALIIALSVGLAVVVFGLSEGVQRGIIQASDPFGVLVIGAKGSGQQLVINTILLQGNPVGVIPYDIYAALSQDPRVQLAVPLANGDNIAGAPLIGTNAQFFELRVNRQSDPAFQLATGTIFAGDFQAVLGSEAARSLGLSVGDRFRASHGFSGASLASDVHEEVYTVVGVLHPSQTSYDKAVFVSLESVWEAHHEDDASTAGMGVLSQLNIEQPGSENSLTAILVLPSGFAEQNFIWQEFYTRTDAQAVFPGQELGALFDLIRQAQQVLNLLGYLVMGIAVLTVFLSVYSSHLHRQRDIAVIRSMGASRWHVFRMVIFEALLITITGGIVGRAIGYGAALMIGQVFTQQSAIPIPIAFQTALEPLIWALTVGGGVIAGVLPAFAAYRTDIAEHLTTS